MLQKNMFIAVFAALLSATTSYTMEEPQSPRRQTIASAVPTTPPPADAPRRRPTPPARPRGQRLPVLNANGDIQPTNLFNIDRATLQAQAAADARARAIRVMRRALRENYASGAMTEAEFLEAWLRDVQRMTPP